MISGPITAGRATLLVLLLAMTACSVPSEQAQDITLAASERSAARPASVTSIPAASSSADGVAQYRVASVVRTLPGCLGERCPSITLKSLSFEGHERFNAFLERSLLGIALFDVSQPKTYRSLAELASEFWKTAEDRYEIVLGAEVKRATSSVVVIELQSYLYSGGAHGMSTVQYVNWLPKFDRILTLKDVVLPGRMKAFEAALKKQYLKWLESNEFAQTDMPGYLKMWPFQFSDNAALMADGIAVTFNHYVLGPYALGMPTILVPYSELKGIINNGLLSRVQVQG